MTISRKKRGLKNKRNGMGDVGGNVGNVVQNESENELVSSSDG